METIIKLTPVYKDYLWGGTRLRDDFLKECNYERVAESWELSANKDGQSILSEGADKGMLFGEYIEKIGKAGLGTKCKDLEFFPLMIKLIDAKQNLSIQVHPDDEYALKVENSFGKNEMWYILDCDPGAFLYVGFNRNTSKEEVEQRVLDNTLTDILNKIYVEKGQSIFIEAGTVHAIGEGALICEIQQNSNVTYRLYDYGRVDDNGNTRELHLQKALDVLNFKEKATEVEKPQDKKESACLVDSKYFSVYRNGLKEAQAVIVKEDSFVSLIFLEGSGTVYMEGKELAFTKGDTFFICAGNREIMIKGYGEFLTVRM